MAKSVETRRKSDSGVRHKQEVDETSQNFSTALHVHISAGNRYQAKTQLSRLLEEVAAGQEIIIAKAGKPIARLVSLRLPQRGSWGS